MAERIIPGGQGEDEGRGGCLVDLERGREEEQGEDNVMQAGGGAAGTSASVHAPPCAASSVRPHQPLPSRLTSQAAHVCQGSGARVPSGAQHRGVGGGEGVLQAGKAGFTSVSTTCIRLDAPTHPLAPLPMTFPLAACVKPAGRGGVLQQRKQGPSFERGVGDAGAASSTCTLAAYVATTSASLPAAAKCCTRSARGMAACGGRRGWVMHERQGESGEGAELRQAPVWMGGGGWG